MIAYQDERMGTIMEQAAAALGTYKSPLIQVPRWMKPRGLSIYCICSAGTATVRADLVTVTPGNSDEEWVVLQGPGTSVFGGGQEYYMVGWEPVGDLITSSVVLHHAQLPIPSVWGISALVAGSGTASFKVHYGYWL